MKLLVPMLRRLLLESRWTLGLTAASLFAWGLFNAWGAQWYERITMSEEMSRRDAMAAMRFRFLGGPAMDFSSAALEVSHWNHPIVILIILGWAIARGSGAISGEIERGTIDVTLSRPISRPIYLLSQVLFALFGLFVLVAGLISGCLFGNLIYTLKSPPTLFALLKPATIVFTTGMAIFGYTLPFSAIDVSRWRPALVSFGLTLAGLVCMGLADQFPRFEWIENLSVYQLYAPVTVLVKGDPLAFNASMLLLVFAVGVAIASAVFFRRDLPSNS
jgi:ABC-2 type transport system permease protein